LNAAEFDQIFSDSLFRKMECVFISGGEPTLRKDLVQVIGVLHRRMPRLKKLILYTNGLNVKSVSRQLPKMIEFCSRYNIAITVRVSLDGIGPLHNKIRGIPHAFDKAMETICYLKDLQSVFSFRFGIATTISKQNLHGLESIVKFCREREIDLIFIMAWISKHYYGNVDQKSHVMLDAGEKQILIKFLKDRIKESGLLNSDAYYYDKLINYLNGDERRKMPCPFLYEGLVLDGLGNMYLCNNSKKLGNVFNNENPSEIFLSPKSVYYRKSLAMKVCPTCESSCLVGIGLEKEIIPFLPFFLKRLGQRIF
jgi:MoaA/NifB/PqqE/SkfB family radical SAM enzyme